MKGALQIALAMVIGLAMTAPAGFAADVKYSGFLGDNYKNMQPGSKGGAKEVWLKPGVMFGNYNKFMVDSVIFFLAEDSAYKGIDPNEMKDLSDGFNNAIVAAFKDKYPIATEPGPGVARIRIAITGFRPSKPAVSGISSISPLGMAFSLVKKGVTGSWTGAGATSAELETLDSLSGDVIAVAVDEKTAGYTERFSKWGSAQEAFKFWAERIVGFIDTTRDMR
jgi:hypothetical protein